VTSWHRAYRVERKGGAAGVPTMGTPQPDHWCGATDWQTWDDCRAGMSRGAVLAGTAGIATVEACAAQCAAECPEGCKFVSFRAAGDDCSWYSECAMTPRDDGYTSAALVPADAATTDVAALCTPEPIDLSSATATSSSHNGDHTAPSAIDGVDTTYWEQV
jgi:hypothetical protein